MVNHGWWNQTTKQVAAVYLPFWPIDLLRRQRQRQQQSQQSEPFNQPRSEQPILLTQQVASVITITHGCEQALEAGVHPGMKLSHGRALLHAQEIDVESYEPERCQQALEKLAQWMMRYSPFCAVDGSDGVLLNVTGGVHLFGGAEAMLHTMQRELASLGVRSRMVMAPTFAAARALARFGDEGLAVVHESEVRDALARLPIQALSIESDAIAALSAVGIESIGQLRDVPRSALPARCGSDVLLALDQAHGEAIEMVTPLQPAQRLFESLRFEYPVTSLATIEHVTRQLLLTLCERLLQRESGTRLLMAQYDRYEHPPICLSLPLSQPSRNSDHLWKLLQPHVEQLHMGHGVEGVKLTVASHDGLPHEQGDWGLRQTKNDHGSQFHRLVDTLTNRLGPNRVVVMEPIESHLPEQAARFEAMVQPGTARQKSKVQRNHAHASQSQARVADGLDRPSLVYSVPHLIRDVEVNAHGHLLGFSYQRQRVVVRSSHGPERLLGTWWQLPSVSVPQTSRDYFKVQDEDGLWWWVFRDRNSGQWFLHGLWA